MNVNFALGRLAVDVDAYGESMTVDDMHAEMFHDFELLERSHTYIQFIFPTDAPSNFNRNCTPLTPEEARRISLSLAASLRLLYSFIMMLRFYGFRFTRGVIEIDHARMPERLSNMKRATHNNLRITRILRSLVLLGCKPLARAWLSQLENLVETSFGEARFSLDAYWRPAVHDEIDVEWPRSNAFMRVHTRAPTDVARMLCSIVCKTSSPSSLWALRLHLVSSGVALQRYLVVGIESCKHTFLYTPARALVLVVDWKRNVCRRVAISCLDTLISGSLSFTADAMSPVGGLAIYEIIRSSSAHASHPTLSPCFCSFKTLNKTSSSGDHHQRG